MYTGKGRPTSSGAVLRINTAARYMGDEARSPALGHIEENHVDSRTRTAVE